MKLMKRHGSIEVALESLKEEKKKEVILEDFRFEQAREMFKNPEVTIKDELPELKWTKVDVEALVEFLVTEKSFSEDRVRRAAERANASRGKSAQARLDTFFTVTPKRKVESKPEPQETKTAGKKKRKMTTKKKSSD